MELIVILILVGATAGLILWPLLSRPEARSAEGPASPLVPVSRGHAALSALKELEFDLATGKIAEDDYKMLRARYEARAVEALTDAPAVRPVAPDEALEAEIRAARGRRFCTSCGSALPSGARFCPSCGTAALGAPA
ncbi:MAG TPA: zinc-ribbon domain-containing protein [bacterium]|nr:zinc-ribbon domain-containing protein [bacterium]